MAWVALLVAGLFEVGWAVCLKYTKGFTEPLPTVGFALCMLASVGLLALAMKTLPLGTAYTVWTGIGAVGAVIMGIALFGEPVEARRLFCAGLVLAGVMGLKLLSPH